MWELDFLKGLQEYQLSLKGGQTLSKRQSRGGWDQNKGPGGLVRCDQRTWIVINQNDY